MARVTANHRFLKVEINRQYDIYKVELKRHDELSSHLKQLDLHDKVHWSLITDLNRIAETMLGIKYALALNLSAYIEAIANWHLSHLLEKEQFQAIESCSVIEKWSAIIPMVQEGYIYPKSLSIHEHMATLMNCRNTITHMKPEIIEGKERKHKGFNPDRISFDQSDRVMIINWINLPDALLGNMEAQIGNNAVYGLKFFSGIGIS